MRILVVDDSAEVAAQMASKIGDAASGSTSVVTLSDKTLRAAISDLRKREASWRDNPAWSPAQYNGPFDDIDLLVVDYRLAELYPADAFLTGEDVAALARRYSHVGPIVSVNRFGDRRFDLRLRAGEDSWADLDIAHDDLQNPRVWSAQPGCTYRPWAWPSLEELPRLFRQRVDFALRHMDSPVVSALEMPADLLHLMPTNVAEALGADLSTATFLDVAIHRAFRAPKTPKPSKRQLARVAAAVVSKWLAGHVLPGQETLIDAPHLVAMYPSLFEGQKSLPRLNQLCVVEPEADLPLTTDLIKESRFRPEYWLDRPAWWTEQVLENRQLVENDQPWKKVALRYAFAEDTSCFHSVAELTSFEAPGSLGRRFVRQPDPGVAYEPARRLVGSRE